MQIFKLLLILPLIACSCVITTHEHHHYPEAKTQYEQVCDVPELILEEDAS